MTTRPPIQIRTAGNGEMIYDNLSEGIFIVAACLVDEIIAISNDGRFWPFEAEIVGSDYRRRIHYVRMKEVG